MFSFFSFITSSQTAMASFLFARRRNTTPSGFDFSSTAEEVTQGIDASHLTAIITGASSGLGLESTRVLALRGAQVVIAVRNVVAGERVKEAILIENKNARVHVLEVDLSSMHSIRTFCNKFISMNIPLNILLNNAGIMGCPFQLSKDGIELQFATNHIGPFLLTNLLLDHMKATAQKSNIEGRIIVVSSRAHWVCVRGLQLDTLNDERGYSSFLAYAKSKLANILYANELARRLQAEEANITVNSLHPGIIITNIVHHNYLVAAATYFKRFAFFLKTVPQGAATQCFLSLHPFVNSVTGKYFVDSNFAARSQNAKDPKLAMKLWEFSEQLTSIKTHQK